MFSRYRTIAFDLPFHGTSGVAFDETDNISLAIMAKSMAESIIALQNGPYIICAVSLGTNILAEMTALDIMPKGICMLGSTVMGEVAGIGDLVLPGADFSVLLNDEPATDDIKRYAEVVMNNRDVDFDEMFLRDFQLVQAPFRSTFLQGIMAGNISDEIKLLQRVQYPVAWIFGAAEKVVNTAYLDQIEVPKWRDQVFCVAQAGHLVHLDAAKEVNRLLVDFSVDCFS